MALISQPLAFTCTPSSLLASSPCLACLSETELLAALVAIGMISSGEDVATVMQNSACFTCMSKKQMLQAFVTVFGNALLGEQYSAEDVLDKMKCLRGCSSQKALQAAFLYLACEEMAGI